MTKIAPGLNLYLSAIMVVISTLIGCKLSWAAGDRYCDNHTDQLHIGVSGGSLQEEPLDNNANVAMTRRELNAGSSGNSKQDRSTAFDVNYQYTIVSYEGTQQPMTNGHLHSLDLPVSWQRKSEEYTLDYYLAPVLSVSSNALKNPELLDREALQLWTGMIYKKNIGRHNAWLLGFRSDYRFGPYRIYPVAGFCWRPDTNWQLQLALPDLSIRRQFANGISINLFAGPDGNKWHVFSKDTRSSSDFFYNAIVSGFSIEWRLNQAVWLELSAVRHSRREFSFELEDGTHIESSADTATGLTVSAGVIF